MFTKLIFHSRLIGRVLILLCIFKASSNIQQFQKEEKRRNIRAVFLTGNIFASVWKTFYEQQVLHFLLVLSNNYHNTIGFQTQSLILENGNVD